MATTLPSVQQDPTVIEFDVRTDEMLVNMGPQHPSTHGVLRLVLRTDGEVISEVTPHLGYLHRCAEKIGENVTPIQYIPYTDRMDYLAGMNMNLGYSLAVEKLCAMKIPEKAQVIRVIIAELNRIASHLVGMGAYGLDLGTFSPFLYAFREREMFLDHFKPRIEEYHTLLTRNHIFVQRTANIGVMSKEMAVAYGCTGPMLRGSLDRDAGDPVWDLRKTEPYCGYEQYDFKAIVPPFPEKPAEAVLGDAWHRFYVRMLEIPESIKLIEQGIRRYATAQGSHRIEPPRHLPAGEAYLETECPRGQMGFYVVGRFTKDPVPLRVRARSSSFSNLSVTNP